MSTVVFVLIGLAACGFTRGLFNNTIPGLLLDLCLGVVGAVTAGSFFNYIVGVGVARFDIASRLVAIAGAAAVLAAYHAVLWAARSRGPGRGQARSGVIPSSPTVPGSGGE